MNMTWIQFLSFKNDVALESKPQEAISEILSELSLGSRV